MTKGEPSWSVEPIAVIGLACRFGGEAKNPEKLWHLLAEGRSAWSEIPSSRFHLGGSYHPAQDQLNTTHVKGGHFLEQDIGLFDAHFFNFSAQTAATLDPQFRLLLESVYEAAENAGITMAELAGSNTSVFAGTFSHDYREMLVKDPDCIPRFYNTGVGASMASNRISHFFDLRGPSMTIDTGCSTSMVALHQACQSLRCGESDLSVVGGSNLLLSADQFKNMGSLGLLSADGKSYSFDSRASGYGRGEGVATVLLKRLKDACAAGDQIRAVIRETMVNQDGKTDTITTPSQTAQETLMRECYRKVGLDPVETQYYEAHGTGTRAGDPIEAKAVAAVFRPGRPADDPLLIGSIKTNIGHTEPTSGLASVIKVVLALEKGSIPPSINFEKPNEELALEEWKLKVVRDLEPWPARHGIRRASIANFGYGGTNAHVIIESGDSWLPGPARGIVNGKGTETNGANSDSTNGNGVNGNRATRNIDCLPRIGFKIFVLSSKDERSCRQMLSNMKEYLKATSASSLIDETVLIDRLAYTLGQRRTRFNWIAAHPAQRLQDLFQSLESSKFCPSRVRSNRPRIGFVFTGQGAQWHAMGRELLQAYPVYKASILEAEQYLKEFGSSWSLLEELSRDAESSKVGDLALSIPICVAVQISLVRLLRAWGILPTAVTSHSSGEVAAAYTVGVLSYRSAMAMSWSRSLLMTQILPQRGAMLAVGLGVEEIQRYICRLTERQASLACINSPSSVTVSGDLAAVEELESMVKADGIFARRLKVDAAYHSDHMGPLVSPYITSLRNLGLGKEENHMLKSIAYSSPCTGGRVSDADLIASPEHWANSMARPVLFVDAFRDMAISDSNSNIDVIIEVGPHAALSGPIHDILSLSEFKNLELPYASCLVRNKNAVETMQGVAARLLREGYPVDIQAINWPCGNPSVPVLHDLPPYPWNHQTRYWTEPRYSKTVRERKHPPHEQLGSLEPGANPDAPSWRNILRINQAPWIRDHVVQSEILYPGAGYVCLAIEAIAQMTRDQENENHVIGYRLREVDFLEALVIPDNAEGIEIQTRLRPAADSAIGSRDWKHFEVFSVTADNKWTEHARGLIVAELEGSPDVTEQPNIPGDEAAYTRRIDPKEFYTHMAAGGIDHGHVFRNIKAIQQTSKGQSLAVISIAKTTPSDSLPQRDVLHATTLDSVFQAAYTTLPLTRSDTPKIPTKIKSLWVSQNIHREAGLSFRAYSALGRANTGKFQANVTLVDAEPRNGGSPVLLLEGLVCQAVGGAIPLQDTSKENEICSTLTWAPDVSFLPPCFFKEKLSFPVDPEETEIVMDLRRACLYFVYDALAELTAVEVQQLQGHQKKFHAWMELQVRLAKEGRLGPDSEHWFEESLDFKKRGEFLEAVGTASINGQMVLRLGTHITSILRQEITALELMLEGKLLYEYYVKALKWGRSVSQLTEMIGHLVHKNPRANILEIGAGTGGATRHVLNMLGTEETGGPLAAQYHFTDISSGFFEAAQKNFAEWNHLLTFRKLDIEQDPSRQGFELGSYDIVIACQVLHATKSMAATMGHVYKLLKPGGKLLLIETTQDQVDVQFTFGLLPGWWLSEEEERQWSPSLTVPSWDRTLKGAGFSGVDVELRDCDSEELYSFSTIMSTVPTAPSKIEPEVVLVTGSHSPPDQWLEALQGCITRATCGQVPKIETLESVDATGKVCVFLGELQEPFLQDLDAAGLGAIKGLATSCEMLLWITRGGAVECDSPEFGLAHGFLRALRLEYAGRQYSSLDLDPQKPLWATGTESTVGIIVSAMIGGSVNNWPTDYEFADRDGVILIPRFHKDTARNMAVSPGLPDKTKPLLGHFQQPDLALRLTIGSFGLIDTLVFSEDASLVEELPQDFLEVEPRAFGLNFRDVMVAMGQLEEDLMGFECSGLITRVGSSAMSRGYKPGDRVSCAYLGVFSSRVRVPWTSAVHIPGDMSFEAAASFPVIFATAYIGLYDVARLQKSDSILIHAAAGGVGQAAIILAKQVGAEVFATVGTPEKKQFIMETYGVPADHIFSSRDTSFGSGVRAMTHGRGVDVVLNSLAGPLLQEGFNCLAPLGHFIEIGKKDLEANNRLELGTFARGATFSSVDLLTLSQLKGRQLHRVLVRLAQMMEDKTISTVQPITSYPLTDFEKAFRLLQTGRHIGKIIISVSPQETVPILPRSLSVNLSTQASYLLVGGVGGIGRSIAQWMVTRGARNLILLSRNAAVKENSGSFVAKLEQAGCRVKAIGCDVSNPLDLAEALRECHHLPPIKGVIQAAMVLQDSILERMTINDWSTAIQPKVQGTWNLHKQLLHEDLDFFIMLSSLAGIIGHASQSNYAAGGAFQDALARHRVAQGLSGVSIDLGIVKSVGYVASTQGVEERMSKAGYLAMSEDQVLAVVESAILTPRSAQIVTGLNNGPGSHWDRPPLGYDARFAALRYRQPVQNGSTTTVGSKSTSGSLSIKLAAAASLDEIQQLILYEMTKKLADIFMMPSQDIDPSQPPLAYGVDSLVAVELRNMLALHAGADISIFNIMKSASLVELAAAVAEKSRHTDRFCFAAKDNDGRSHVS